MIRRVIRLTKNEYNDEWGGYDLSRLLRCADKLYDLENIEQELGIDLVTLFKALKNGIYGKIGNKIEHILAPHLSWHNQEIYIFKIKDCGKTWALTREELENEKD